MAIAAHASEIATHGIAWIGVVVDAHDGEARLLRLLVRQVDWHVLLVKGVQSFVVRLRETLACCLASNEVASLQPAEEATKVELLAYL